MEPSKEELLVELRYAQRLCERTARLYRRVQTVFTFLVLVAGSSAIATLSAQMPTLAVWLAIAFAVFGSINMAIRPAEKIAENEADVRKYAGLLAKARQLDATALRQLLQEARMSDVAEIEALRSVAYNDVMREIDRPEALIELNRYQKLMGTLA